MADYEDGTYELCGPKVQGNPEGMDAHVLVPHGKFVLREAPRDFEGLAAWLRENPYEGIVWHHPDGRMAKLKRKDFPCGYVGPLREAHGCFPDKQDWKPAPESPLSAPREWEQAVEAADRLAIAADTYTRCGQTIDQRIELIEATYNYRQWRGRIYQSRPLEGQFRGQ
jgi:hypothetical protein